MSNIIADHHQRRLHELHRSEKHICNILQKYNKPIMKYFYCTKKEFLIYIFLCNLFQTKMSGWSFFLTLIVCHFKSSNLPVDDRVKVVIVWPLEFHFYAEHSMKFSHYLSGSFCKNTYRSISKKRQRFFGGSMESLNFHFLPGRKKETQIWQKLCNC